MDDLTLAALFGLAIGGALGALGGGGSILAVPALVYGLGMPVRQAIPTSLLVVGLTAAGAAAAHVRAGTVWFRTAAVFAAAGIVGSFAGAWVNHRLGEGLVLGGLAAVMVVASIGMWRRAGRQEPDPSPGAATRAVDRVTAHTAPKVVVAGLGLGVMTGLFGVGGGFLAVPVMALVLDLPTPVAIGTSLVVIAVNASAGLVAHLGLGPIDVPVAVAFAAGGLLGALGGQCLASRLSSGALGRAFAVFVMVVGGLTLVDVMTT